MTLGRSFPFAEFSSLDRDSEVLSVWILRTPGMPGLWPRWAQARAIEAGAAAVSPSEQGRCECPVSVSRLTKAEGAGRGQGRDAQPSRPEGSHTEGLAGALTPRQVSSPSPWGSLCPGPTRRDGRAQAYSVRHQLCLSPREAWNTPVEALWRGREAPVTPQVLGRGGGSSDSAP